MDGAGVGKEVHKHASRVLTQRPHGGGYVWFSLGREAGVCGLAGSTGWEGTSAHTQGQRVGPHDTRRCERTQQPTKERAVLLSHRTLRAMLSQISYCMFPPMIHLLITLIKP